MGSGEGKGRGRVNGSGTERCADEHRREIEKRAKELRRKYKLLADLHKISARRAPHDFQALEGKEWLVQAIDDAPEGVDFAPVASEVTLAIG